VASFDTAWSRIRVSYYDTTFRGNDWQALRLELRPRVERARSTDDVRRAIVDLYTRLGDSHFALVPAEAANAIRETERLDTTSEPGTAGIHARILDDRVVVSSVDRNSGAERAGVMTGWEIVRLGSVESEVLLRGRRLIPNPRDARRSELQIALRFESGSLGAAGSQVELVAKDERGTTRRVQVERTPLSGKLITVGALPPQHFQLSHERYADADGCVGVIRFNTWMVPLLPAMERAMEQLSMCRALVVDLRGNPGGVAGLIIGFAGFFVDREVPIGTITTRAGRLSYIVNPRRSNSRGERVQPYAGHTAVLVDRVSASTSELFAEGMRDLGRVRIFGDTTAGEALPATIGRLPNGDLFMYPLADFHSAGGRRVESAGVVPDVIVPLRRQDLLRGRDAALAAALAWAAGSQAVPAATVTKSP
jgi:carboxyl-terminal processing protease